MTAPTGRAEVRDLIAIVVAAAVLPLSATVFRARTFPLQLPELPAVLVYGWEEDKRCMSIVSPDSRYDTSCAMIVQAAVTAATPELVEEKLEIFAGAIVNAVLKADSLVGPAGAIERVSSVKTKLDVPRPTGDQIIGELTVTFVLEWSELYEIPDPGMFDLVDPDASNPLCTELDYAFKPA